MCKWKRTETISLQISDLSNWDSLISMIVGFKSIFHTTWLSMQANYHHIFNGRKSKLD